ncbi:LPS assembly lipoprotein LptE [Phenylobacterium sp.]|uniref:LPS assembly lipoprotein LptE n=1 Tax=Phenylobacterium sp. TaxID=1871053 RepID=UPI00289F0533|nr:LPS assembly lipoprotein LptE [Phenylobacterium sp.]
MNRVVVSAVLAAGAITLAGCGFTPLYGDPGVATQLNSVHVTTPPSRTGQLIREHLDDALANAKGGAPKYRMDLALGETRYPRGLRVDNVATRYEYVLTANYTLVSTASGVAVKSGTARAQVTYDSADQPYASITAQQDAQDRAAAECARKIQLELAAWLATQGKS